MSPSRLLWALAICSLVTPAWAEEQDGAAQAAVADGGLRAPLETVPTGVLVVPPTGSQAERERWLTARLDAILARVVFAKARVGVAVSEVASGRALYRHNDTMLLNPASNVKLVTTAAALTRLGPEFRFKTFLVADVGTVKGGAIEGNIYLRGQGDPALVVEELWKMVADLAAQGIKRVAGDVVVDDTYFDRERIGPGFEQKSEDLPFRAPAGAVSLNYNACAVLVLPGAREGAPPRVVLEPAAAYFVVHNQARTVVKGHTDLIIKTAEAPDHTVVYVSGTIVRGDAGHLEHRRVAHPDLYAGYALRELLVRRGIKVTGSVTTAVAPPAGRILVTHLSPPLGVIVRDVNKTSNNFMAEQILKTLGAETLGRPGTWPKGLEVVAKYLEGLGIARGHYRMTNGSGLYDSNSFSAAQLVKLLGAVQQDFRLAADFVGSLALAGADGTISKRLAGRPSERLVRAKTGTLLGVSCLSGYAGASGRLPLAFAILMNNLDDNATQEARRAQDEIADILVAFWSVN